MIKGKNSIELNSDTVKQIIQHYFDTVVFVEGQSPVIETILVNQVGTYSNSGMDFRKLAKMRVETVDRKTAFQDNLSGEK